MRVVNASNRLPFGVLTMITLNVQLETFSEHLAHVLVKKMAEPRSVDVTQHGKSDEEIIVAAMIPIIERELLAAHRRSQTGR